MRVLGLCSYPVEAASTRYRLAQFVAPLAERGIDLTISPFLDNKQFKLLYQNKSFLQNFRGLGKSFAHRISEIYNVRQYDLIFIQREAMFFGPAFFERVFQTIGKCPIILDLDDATYIRYVSPTYGKIGSFFKFFGKTDFLIERAEAVVCGNRYIAEYVEKKGTKSFVVPTVVDTNKFTPVEKPGNAVPVVGWIGTHSTFPLLQSIFPVLENLAKKHEFVLKIVGAGVENVELNGVKVENLQWDLKREIRDFQSLDIGLYPITTTKSANKEWITGKSGFKAIQYLAMGIPFVMTEIGVCAEIGEPDRTHFNVTTEDEWYRSLDKLLSDEKLRVEMGKRGREFSVKNYAIPAQVDILERVFKFVGEKR